MFLFIQSMHPTCNSQSTHLSVTKYHFIPEVRTQDKCGSDTRNAAKRITVRLPVKINKSLHYTAHHPFVLIEVYVFRPELKVNHLFASLKSCHNCKTDPKWFSCISCCPKGFCIRPFWNEIAQPSGTSC